jgi:hypothetical protein
MLDAHSEAGFVVGMPFAAPGLYDFGTHSGMTARVGELGSIMLKHRWVVLAEGGGASDLGSTMLNAKVQRGEGGA